MASQNNPKKGPGSVTPVPRDADRDACRKWSVRVSGGRDPVSRRYKVVERTFEGTETQAWRYAGRLLTEIEDGKITVRRCTFDQLVDRVLKNKETRGRAPKTLDEYRRMAEWLKQPEQWADRQIRSITPSDIDELMDRIIKSKGQSAAAHYFRFARTCFRQAVAWDLLDRPPTDRAEEVSDPESSGKAPSPQIVQRLIDGAESGVKTDTALFTADPEFAGFIFAASTTMLGPGELCALTVGDIRLSDSVLQVQHGVSVVAGERHVRATKTKSRKAPVALDPATVEVLRRQLDQVEKRCAAVGVEFDDHRFLWSLEADHSIPRSPGGMSQKFGRLRKVLGITGVRLYDLRHYGSTQGFGLGVDPKTMQGRMRHSDAKITLEVYTDVLKENDFQAAKLIAGTLTAPGSFPFAIDEAR